MDIKVEGQNYEIKVKHSDGGTSFYDYSKIEKGVYLHITPCELKKTEHGGEIRTSRLGDGNKFLLVTYGRKNRKKLELAASLVTPKVQELVETYHLYSKKGDKNAAEKLTLMVEDIKKNLV